MTKLLKILIAVAISLVLLHNSQLRLGLLATIYESPLPTLAVCTLCLIIVALQSWRWYRLNAAQGIDLSFARTIIPTYLGVGFNAVLPGSVGGDFVRLYFILKKYPAKKSAATLSILVDRISSLMGIIIIVCLTAPYYLATYQHNDALNYILLTCLGICVGGAWAFLLFGRRLSKKLIKFFNQTRFAHGAGALFEAINIYCHSKLIILESLITSIATQLLLLTVILIIGDMMGLPAVSLFDYMMALAIGQIANLIPLTPGGIGIGEAAFANIIILLNPGATAAYATVFLALRILSAASYFPGVLIGVFGFHLRNQDGPAPLLTKSAAD